jgi:hypothetical protein
MSASRKGVVLLLVHTAAAAPVRHAVVLDSSQGMCEHEAAVYTCFIETVLQPVWLFVAWLFTCDGWPLVAQAHICVIA